MLTSWVSWSWLVIATILIATSELPKNEEFVDENGIRTTIEYAVNDEGKKIKVCRLFLFL